MKPGHGQKFRRQQETAIVALLSQPTLDEAAKYAKVGGATLWRWLKRPDFQEAYRQARREALGQATGQLQQAASLAVSALRDIIQDRNVTAAARVTAARTFWKSGSSRRK